MHAVTCPSCGRTLTSAKPLDGMKLGCPACGAVFLGTGRPEAPPSSAPPSRYAPPRKSGLLPMAIIAGVGLVVILVLIAVLSRYADTIWVTHLDANGQLVRGRLTHQEANELAEQARRRAQQQAAQAMAQRGVPYPGTGWPATAPGTGGPPPPPPVPELPVDKNITLLQWDKIPAPGSPDGGLIVGRVKNLYTHALEELQVTPQILGADQRAIATLRTYTCRYVPADGDARFSVAYDGVPTDRVESLRVSARAKPLGPPAVCCPAEVYTLDHQGQSVVVTGSARNSGASALTDARVLCDLFTRDGQYVGSAEGKLDEVFGGRIRPGYKATFQLTYQPAGAVWPETITLADARVIGKQE